MIMENPESVGNLYSNLDRLVSESNIEKKDIENCQKTIDFLTSLYGDQKRKHEDLFTYEHSVNTTNLMIGTYFERKDSDDRFVELFRERPMEFIYTALFHDAIEDTSLTRSELYNYLRKKLKLGEEESERIVDNVSLLSKDWQRIGKVKRQEYLADLKNNQVNKVAKYVKCFDIWDNSKDVHLGMGQYQFKKIKDDYFPFVKEVYYYVFDQIRPTFYRGMTAQHIDAILLQPLKKPFT